MTDEATREIRAQMRRALAENKIRGASFLVAL